MSIKTWVTQPARKFDSFYYYDTINLDFVRIRLELGRTDRPPYDPNPGVFPNHNRFVGFVENLNDYNFDNFKLWTVNDNDAIVYKAGFLEEEVLSKSPAPGKSPVDFTLEENEKHPDFIHFGNEVIEKAHARLPKNSKDEQVTLEMLETIAEKLAHADGGINLGLSTETEQQLGDKIFTLYEILTGSIASKDVRPFSVQMADAHAYFNNKDLPQTVSQDNPYADKDGLIEFIIGTELIDDKEVMKNLEIQKQYLIALTSVVTDYVNRYAQAYGEEHKTDAALWAEAMSHLPLMGPSKVDTQSYSRHIQGVTIAVDFLQFLLDIVTQDGSAALNRFTDFLEKQGDALRVGVDSNKDHYNTITISVSIEVIKVGTNIVYVPKVKQYKVKFDRENTKWAGACVSYEYVDINFNYLYAANVFDYEALQDPDVKKEFDMFIKDQRKAQIERSTTFFNGEFPKKVTNYSPKNIK
jgi:hypothetical protein